MQRGQTLAVQETRENLGMAEAQRPEGRVSAIAESVSRGQQPRKHEEAVLSPDTQ